MYTLILAKDCKGFMHRNTLQAAVVHTSSGFKTVHAARAAADRMKQRTEALYGCRLHALVYAVDGCWASRGVQIGVDASTFFHSSNGAHTTRKRGALDYAHTCDAPTYDEAHGDYCGL